MLGVFSLFSSCFYKGEQSFTRLPSSIVYKRRVITMTMSIETQSGYFRFYNMKTGEEISGQMSAEKAIEIIWQIHAETRR